MAFFSKTQSFFSPVVQSVILSFLGLCGPQQSNTSFRLPPQVKAVKFTMFDADTLQGRPGVSGRRAKRVSLGPTRCLPPLSWGSLPTRGAIQVSPCWSLGWLMSTSFVFEIPFLGDVARCLKRSRMCDMPKKGRLTAKNKKARHTPKDPCTARSFREVLRRGDP